MNDQRHLAMIFKQAYDQYADAIFRFCYFKTSDRELALDLMQQTYLQAWTYLRGGEEIRDMRPFLYRLANNLVIDWYRKKKTDSLDSLMEAGFDPPAEQAPVSELAEFNEALQLLQRLEEKDRQLIIWRYVEDWSPKEIAQVTNESENNVSVHLHRALVKIKKIIANQKYEK
ncbi:MAG: RNA polymerase sigma factor [bacterium]|nr:RNA polymerase sigma factor [bacterium]